MHNKISFEKSYIAILEPQIEKEAIAVYEVLDNKLIPLYQTGRTKFSLFVVLIKKVPKTAVKKNIRQTINKLAPNGKLHLLIEPSTSKLMSYFTIIPYLLTKRELLKCCNIRNIESYGIEGDPWSPKLIASFKKNILKYVVTEAYRHIDNPIKNFIKKLIATVFGFWIWKGYIVIVCLPNQTDQLPTSPPPPCSHQYLKING